MKVSVRDENYKFVHYTDDACVQIPAGDFTVSIGLRSDIRIFKGDENVTSTFPELEEHMESAHGLHIEAEVLARAIDAALARSK